MSCDGDCTLAPGTAWEPCSDACNIGFQNRGGHVLIQSCGFRKCPLEDGVERLNNQECKTQFCVGAEICIIEDWEALKAMLDWRRDEKRTVHWRLDAMLDDWDDEDDGEWHDQDIHR